MIIYFDESYDNNINYFILGYLFNFNSTNSRLLKEIIAIKENLKLYGKKHKYQEIKYSTCSTEKKYSAAEQMVDSFIKSNSYYRAIVIEKNKRNLNLFGKSEWSKELKKAILKKKFAEMLLLHNSNYTNDSLLYCDEMQHCSDDFFVDKLKETFCYYYQKHNIPRLKDILEIDSKAFEYQVSQINDILTGCILSSLISPQNEYKNKIRDHLINRLKVPSLLPSFWKKLDKTTAMKEYPKYNVWYWEPYKTEE